MSLLLTDLVSIYVSQYFMLLSFAATNLAVVLLLKQVKCAASLSEIANAGYNLEIRMTYLEK